MKKILNSLFCLSILLLMQNSVNAGVIDKTISNSGINKSSISVSVKDVKTGKTIYKLHDKKPSMPASTLKLITLAASVDTLGNDYKFSTKLYKNTNNELFLVLNADPFLSSSDLKYLIKTAKDKNIVSPKNIFIDDYIFDNKEWGEGWQWDDDLNPLMPKFSSYNLDNNLLDIIISPAAKGAPANIYVTKFYPTTFMNLITTGDINDIKLSRNNHISPDIINAEGTVKEQEIVQIPINHPKRYFILRLEEAIREENMDYYGDFPQKKLPLKNVYLVAQVDHPLKSAITLILKDSSNFAAETVFKTAGAKFLAENKGKEGVVALPSGLQYKILKAGDGPKPKADDTVKCHYEGRLINGTVFDSSIRRGEPAEFPVSGVIQGWVEALQLMPVGSKWQLYIPSELAYGSHGAGRAIGPNETLIFDVELLAIV